MTNSSPDASASPSGPSRMRRIRLVAFIAIPVLVIVAGAVFAFRTFASAEVCAVAIADAETTVATASGVDRYRIGSVHDGEKRYVVEYSYEVDGTEYVARGRDFSNLGRANRFAEEQPTATAHYDPAQPATACISYE